MFNTEAPSGIPNPTTHTANTDDVLEHLDDGTDSGSILSGEIAG